MWELKKKILRISSVLSMVEPEPGDGPLHRLRLRVKSTGSDRLRLRNTESMITMITIITMIIMIIMIIMITMIITV